MQDRNITKMTSVLRMTWVVSSLMIMTFSMAMTQQIINVSTQLPVSKITSPGVGGSDVTEAVVDVIRGACIFDEDYLFLRRLATLETNDGTAARTFAQPGYFGGIWRVDEAMYNQTKANSPQLQTKYAAIRDVFGIDWLHTQWQDLQKPLYSGLAAALYTFIQGPIPISVEQQGRYSHEHYHSANTAYNYTRVSQNIPVCDRDTPTDLVFLLDSTTTQDDFLRMREFVHHVTGSPFNVTKGNIRVSVYQFGGQRSNGSPDVRKDISFDSYRNQEQLQSLLHNLAQVKVTQGTGSVGEAVKAVVEDAFMANGSNPLRAQVVVALYGDSSGSRDELVSATQEAVTRGVSVLGVGVGGHSVPGSLGPQVSPPSCVPGLRVPSFQDLTDLVPLLQRSVCNEPALVQGKTIQCAIAECRNVAFPLTANTTTLVANLTCDDGRVYVSTRNPRPARGFHDYSAVLDGSSGASYVTVHDVTSHFLYVDLTANGVTAPGCVAKFSTVEGVVGQTKDSACQDWKYPTVNPCQASGRTVTRFAYDLDPGMFIQCDLQNNMYLSKCPPGEPFYDPGCETCVGGQASPLGTGCQGGRVSDPATPYCGLPHNPCTQDNILQGHYFFACPLNETTYLQCNNWGHAFVKQCPEHEVWRQKSLTCEYESTAYNPCGTAGVRYYPYPPDPHYFIDCGADMVPNLLKCRQGLVWNSHTDTCDFSHNTSPPHVTQNPVTTSSPLPETSTSNPIPNPSSSSLTSTANPTPNPSTGLLSSNYAAPCTKERVSSGQLFWPYEGQSGQYVQCDLWGDAFVKSCQAGFSFDPFSHTCVNGDVVVDNQLPDGLVG